LEENPHLDNSRFYGVRIVDLYNKIE